MRHRPIFQKKSHTPRITYFHRNIGTNTKFTQEFSIGEYINFGDEQRKIISIPTDTSLTVDSVFDADATDVTVTQTGYPDVWNDRFLEAYATAKIKYQWGTNLSKFAGIQMPGGVTLDGPRIMQEAKEEIEKMEEEMYTMSSLPSEIFTG